MQRKERIEIVLWAKVVALAVGLVLAVVYQFTGVVPVLFVGLAIFAAAFLMMALTEIEKLVYLANTKIDGENEDEMAQKAKNLKNKKLVACVKMLLAGGFAVFTVVVMFLF